MPFASATQPLCRYCGKKIAKRTVYRYCYEEEPRREAVDSRSGQTLKLYVPDHVVGVFRSKEELQKVTNGTITYIKYTSHPDRRIYAFSEWDNESYIDRFFCSDEHAKDFGYACAEIKQDGEPKLAMQAFWDARKAQMEKGRA